MVKYGGPRPAERWNDKRLKAQAQHRNFIMAKYEPPAEVWEEHLRAARAPRTLTAIAFGDPLPGRSALDREAQNESKPRSID